MVLNCGCDYVTIATIAKNCETKIADTTAINAMMQIQRLSQ